MEADSSSADGDILQPDHEHTDGLAFSGRMEQAGVYVVATLGLLANALLLALVLCQRHTRRLASAFVLHSVLLNLLMSCLALGFAHGLGPDGIEGGSCRSLTVGYIVFLTVWVFNLIPAACSEVYYLDYGGSRRPRGTACCVAFGLSLVYIFSAILHLGPTLIGANFEWQARRTRCIFLHGQPKNYMVYLTWMIIVTAALAVAAYYLVVFRRSVDESIRARLRTAGSGLSRRILSAAATASAAAPTSPADAQLAASLATLAAVRTNRQRVLCGICGAFVACWYPLYLLVLLDPQSRAPLPLYHLCIILGFAKTLVEPLTLATLDRAIGRPAMRLCPCSRHLRFVTEADIDSELAAAAAAGCPERSDSTSVIASVSTAAAAASAGIAGVPRVGGRRPHHLQPPRLLITHGDDPDSAGAAGTSSSLRGAAFADFPETSESPNQLQRQRAAAVVVVDNHKFGNSDAAAGRYWRPSAASATGVSRLSEY